MQSALDAAFHLVHDQPGGAAAMALRLGKHPATLCHELTATGSAKLGLELAQRITLLTGDLRILNAFAAACNCLVLPMPAHHTAGIDTYSKLADTAKEFGEFVASVADSVRDGHVTKNELQRVQRELAEMIGAAQDLSAALEQIHQAGKPKAQGLRAA